MPDAEDIHEFIQEDGHLNPDLSFSVTQEMVKHFYGDDATPEQLIWVITLILTDETEAGFVADNVKTRWIETGGTNDR